MDFDANNNNYQTVDFGGLFADPLFKIANSKYMSNAKIKEDYVLDALEGEYIKCKTDLNIDTTKQYIVKIDMSS
ncbi:MAG: hypothetical protein MJ233_03555 [Mycoplasmoidaceae bacterium]|nr:hypothetical protein [Mycoplasmoidaceae bacterium]